MATVNIGDIEFDVNADFDGFASRMRARATAEVKRVEKSLPSVQITPEIKQKAVASELKKAQGLLARRELAVDLDPELNNAEFQRETARIRALVRRLHLVADIDTDIKAPKKTVFNRLAGVFRKAGGDAGNSFNLGFGQSFRAQVFSDPQAAILKLIALFGGLTAAVTPIGPILAGLAASLAALGGILGTVGIAAGVAAIGMNGFFSAVKEGGSALDDLTPSARQTAESIRGLSDEWGGLRRAVQESIFSQVGSSFDRLSQTITQGLQPGMVKIGASIGRIVDAFADWAGSAPGIELISTVMNRVADVFERLRPGLQAFGVGLLQLFNAALPAAGDMADSFSEIGESFRDWTASLDDGKVNKISQAISIMAAGFRDLGKVFGPVLEGLSDAFDDIGPALDTLRSALFPILETLGEDLGATLTTLGPVIASIVTSFADLLTTLKPLAPVLLPVLAGIAAFAAGGPVGVIAALAVAFGSLAAKSEPLREGFTSFFNAIKPVIDQGLKQMQPLVKDLSKALGELGVALGPIAKAILRAMGPAVASQIKFFFRLMGQALKIVTKTVRFVTSLLRGDWLKAWKQGFSLGRFFLPFFNLLNTAVRNIRSMVTRGGAFFLNLGRTIGRGMSVALNAVSRGFSAMGRAVSRGVSTLVRFVSRLPGRLRSAVGNLGSLLFAAGASLIDGLTRGVSSRIGAAIGTVSSAVGRLRNLFPFSPAKEGPFSGRGYTTFSGKALMEDFAKSVEQAAASVTPGVSRALGSIQEATQITPIRGSAGASASPVTVNAPEIDITAIIRAIASLQLRVTLGADRRTKAEWYLDGQRYAEALA
jgi:phage-related protein